MPFQFWKAEQDRDGESDVGAEANEHKGCVCWVAVTNTKDCMVQ